MFETTATKETEEIYLQVGSAVEKTKPRMISLRMKNAYHDLYCYAFAKEVVNNKQNKLLMTIVSGSDSALQSVKAAIDIGVSDMMFGYGEKESETDTNWQFTNQLFFNAEKGKYYTFPMSLNSRRKCLAIVHESVMKGEGYLLSFDENPAKNVSQLLGGKGYGLPILPEWEEPVFRALLMKNYLIKLDLYANEKLFPNGIHLFSLDLAEEQADRLLESLIKRGTLRFKEKGNGGELEKINTLTSYLTDYNQEMAKMLAKKITPGHNPIHDEPIYRVKQYPRTLFPVQEHVVSAAVKHLKNNKAIILQGEMSTGKSSLMTAIADAFYHNKGKKGFHCILTAPPSLAKKWGKEIKYICPNANVIRVYQTADLIAYHQKWIADGRPKPTVPTFFIISFTVLRGDARTECAAPFILKGTPSQVEKESFYRYGHYCPKCGKPHQMVEKVTITDEDGKETEIENATPMTRADFGSTRRLNGNLQNAFCSNKILLSHNVNATAKEKERTCGESLWTKRVASRYSNFKEWTKHEKRVLAAIKNGQDPKLVQISQKELKAKKGYPRKVAAVEYIRRKMTNFADMLIVDEVHMMKAGNSAQGNALGSLVAASKKVVAGTGTLFGGKSIDIYYLLWRLFPHEMVKNGYLYEEVSKFNEEFGNIEETEYVPKNGGSSIRDDSHTNSRGGSEKRTTKKTIPGISPFIFGNFMIQNVINVRLKEVWPDPVPLIDTPTIFVQPSKELKDMYNRMIWNFESAKDEAPISEKGLYSLAMLNYGISMVDNPFTFPDAIVNHEEVWANPFSIDPAVTLPKEEKLQQIIQTEMSEGRKSIVYVKDTGSSVEGRDVRPRLKHKLEEFGAKVCILDTTTTATDNRSEWLEKKMLKEDYDVCIVSQELVKVGLDLLCTPTIIFYQFSWSLFTIEQAKKRAWRIGQTEDCRLFYLAYEDTFQSNLATIIAQKAQATAAINGDVTSDGLSAMLGDSGDLQTLLLQSIQNGGVLEGSSEEWVSQTTDEARKLLEQIGKTKKKITPTKTPIAPVIEAVPTEEWDNLLDLLVHTNAEIKEASGQEDKKSKKGNRKSKATDDQLTFDLFAL